MGSTATTNMVLILLGVMVVCSVALVAYAKFASRKRAVPPREADAED